MEYKVGQRILNIDPDTNPHGNAGQSGVIIDVCGDKVIVRYDNGVLGNSNNPSRYYKVINENKSIMMNIKEFVKNSLLSADEKALREVGFKDSCGNYTTEARDFAINALCEDKKADLLTVATAILAESKKK